MNLRLFEDRFAKVLIGRVLLPYVETQVGVELLPEPFKADLIVPTAARLPHELPGAGLLARLLEHRTAVIESYVGAPTAMDVQVAKAKGALSQVLAQRRRKSGEPCPQGCVLVLANANPKEALDEVFEPDPTQLEPGVWQWHERHRIYLVRNDLVQDRPDTLVFRLLCRGDRRQTAVAEVLKQELEPYNTVLRQFEGRFSSMKSTPSSHEISAEEMQELQEIAEACKIADLEQGREQGRAQGLRDYLLRMVRLRWPELETTAQESVAAVKNAEALMDLLDGLMMADTLETAQSRLKRGS